MITLDQFQHIRLGVADHRGAVGHARRLLDRHGPRARAVLRDRTQADLVAYAVAPRESLARQIRESILIGAVIDSHLASNRSAMVQGLVEMAMPQPQQGEQANPNALLRWHLMAAMLDVAMEHKQRGDDDAGDGILDELADLGSDEGLAELAQLLNQQQQGQTAEAPPDVQQLANALAAEGVQWLAWQAHGQTRSGKTRWKNSDTGEWRYQVNEPGGRRRRQEDAAVAKQHLAKIRNYEDVTEDHLQEMAAKLSSLTVDQLRTVRGWMGSRQVGGGQLKQGLIDAIKNYARVMVQRAATREHQYDAEQADAQTPREVKGAVPAEQPAEDTPASDDAVENKSTGEPRTDAAAASAAQASDYEFARASAIGNRGEDLKNSARHRVNAWRSLQDAEQAGQGDKFATRAYLEKQYPHELMTAVEKNPVTALAMNFALRKYPGKPGYRTHKVTEQDRQQYVEQYQLLVAKVNELALTEPDHKKALKDLRSYCFSQARKLRESDTYNDTANMLVITGQAMLNNRQNDPLSHLNKFGTAMAAKYNTANIAEVIDQVKIHAKDIIEGKTINESIGSTDPGSKPKKFNVASVYSEKASRKGGKPDGSNATEAMDHLEKQMGVRGIQWGNSVTDTEREFHSKAATEALMDLADILGIPESSMSLGSSLGIAFGARGKGTALAHYEPATKVINLTRSGGAGSLAHEWGHFFDNKMAEIEFGGNTSKLMSSTYHHPGKGGAVRQALTDVQEAMSGFRKRLQAFFAKDGLAGTGFYGKSDYWLSGQELFARSFERVIQKKLADAGRENTYLVGLGKNTDNLWPTDEEVDKIAGPMMQLVAAYQQTVAKAPPTATSDTQPGAEPPPPPQSATPSSPSPLTQQVREIMEFAAHPDVGYGHFEAFQAKLKQASPDELRAALQAAGLGHLARPNYNSAKMASELARALTEIRSSAVRVLPIREKNKLDASNNRPVPEWLRAVTSQSQ